MGVRACARVCACFVYYILQALEGNNREGDKTKPETLNRKRPHSWQQNCQTSKAFDPDTPNPLVKEDTLNRILEDS